VIHGLRWSCIDYYIDVYMQCDTCVSLTSVLLVL
jgi:hypothetical protein